MKIIRPEKSPVLGLATLAVAEPRCRRHPGGSGECRACKVVGRALWLQNGWAEEE